MIDKFDELRKEMDERYIPSDEVNYLLENIRAEMQSRREYVNEQLRNNSERIAHVDFKVDRLSASVEQIHTDLSRIEDNTKPIESIRLMLQSMRSLALWISTIGGGVYVAVQVIEHFR